MNHHKEMPKRLKIVLGVLGVIALAILMAYLMVNFPERTMDPAVESLITGWNW